MKEDGRLVQVSGWKRTEGEGRHGTGLLFVIQVVKANRHPEEQRLHTDAIKTGFA